MSDLRKAAEMALESMEEGEYGHAEQTLLEALRQALAQPEQEPVAWHEPDSFGNVTTYKKWALENGWLPLYTQPVDTVNTSQECVDETAKRGHEPVGYVSESGKGAYILAGVDLDDDTPLYTTPPKREWVGLTDEEICKCAGIDGGDTWIFETAYAIAAKLKEKNT